MKLLLGRGRTGLVFLSMALLGCASGAAGPGTGLGGAPGTGGAAPGAGGELEASSSTTTSTGFGGATSSSSTAGSTVTSGPTSTASSSAGTGGGADARHTMVLLASYGAQVMTGTFTTQNGWYMWPQQDPSTDGIGVAFTSLGAYALIRSQNGGSLDWSVWSGQWGTFSPIHSGAATLAAPALTSDAFNLYAAYLATDSTYAYAEYSPGGGWAPTAESLGSGSGESGPAPPTIVLDGGDPLIVYAGDDGDLYDRRRVSGSWQTPHGHGLSGVAGTPAIVALPSHPELLAVFADAASGQVRWTARTSGVWSAPADIVGLASTDPPSLAQLPGGGAVLAVRGVDENLYLALFDAALGSWSLDTTFATTALVEAPAVAPGIESDDAELVFVDMGYRLFQTSLASGAWSTAQLIGSGGQRVALATGH
jgi:hypothetical protein